VRRAIPRRIQLRRVRRVSHATAVRHVLAVLGVIRVRGVTL